MQQGYSKGDRYGGKVVPHTHVAKIIYLAKRVKPECLKAVVSFLSPRYDIDDLAKCKKSREAVMLAFRKAPPKSTTDADLCW